MVLKNDSPAVTSGKIIVLGSVTTEGFILNDGPGGSSGPCYASSKAHGGQIFRDKYSVRSVYSSKSRREYYFCDLVLGDHSDENCFGQEI